MRPVAARARFAAALAALAFAACARPAPAPSDVSVDWSLSSPSPVVGPTSLTLVLSDAASLPVEGARLTVEGNMSHAGMQPVFAAAEDLGKGRYRASLAFTMAGDWILLVSGKLPDGRAVERRIEVAGVRPAA